MWQPYESENGGDINGKRKMQYTHLTYKSPLCGLMKIGASVVAPE
jgi:hypothetical protein